VRLPFVGGAYKGRSSNASSEEAINLFVEKNAGEQGEGALVNVPGSILFSQLPVGEVRGLHTFDSKLYAVCRSNLYRIDAAGNYTDLGSIGTSSGKVSMCDNGYLLAIADGASLKVYSASTSTLTNTGSVNTSSCSAMDGYLIFIEDGTQRFWWTFETALTVDPLDFASVEGAGDNLVALKCHTRQIWLTGTETTEVWYNIGDTQPFSKFQGGFTQMGCAAPKSIARIGNSLVWLALNEFGDATIVGTTGYAIQPLTREHPQVAYQIDQYTSISDAIGYTYQYEGHDFYVLTFPSANVTWCFDITSMSWHKRAHIINNTFPNRERYNCHAFAFEKHLVGDYVDGKVYELNSSYHTMNGEIIPNQRDTMGQMEQDEERIRVRSLQLTGEEGVGGSVFLSYSKDGGHTFSSELETSFGAIGAYSHRAIWRKLGMGREFVFRIIRKVDARTIYKGLIAKRYGE